MIGQTLSHYKILEKIGSGGMGEVYLAEDTKLERKVALKILPAEVAADEERMRRFVQEAKTASALKHPNVVPIFEIDDSNGRSFIVMEFIEGQTLESRIGGHPIAVNQIIDTAIQIADALDEAHSKGIIHRDIKTANIMITPRGQVKILDFGLAKFQIADQSDGASRLKTQTKTEPGVVLGTVQYMSPEQALGKPVDGRSDIFSMGIVLYQMATGMLPFAGKSTSETLNLIINTNPPAIARYNYDLPADLERIIRRCLEKDAERRYQSAHDLLIELKNLKRDTESAPHQQQKERKSRKTLYAAIIGIPVLLAGTFLVWRLMRGPELHSIAVLPFANHTADAKNEYLSDGLTETTINSLSRLPNLKVMARSTVFRFKGREIDPQKIGHDLNVDAVLTGSMSRADNNLIINAELVNVKDGTQIWGDQYKSTLSDLLTVQQDISRKISDQLRVKLTGEEKRKAEKQYTSDSEAYRLYLQGRFFWNKRSDDGIFRAVDYFNQAIAKDPAYALAYVGLADCYVIDGSPFPQKERYPKAEIAAQKALQLDDTLAEAHATLGALNSSEWRWKEAEVEFKRAISLNPNYATARQWYAEFLYIQGHLQEAINMMSRAQELDPLSPIIGSTRGYLLFQAGQLDQAVAQLNKVIEANPDFIPARLVLYDCYAENGQLDRFFQNARKFQMGDQQRVGFEAAEETFRKEGANGLYLFLLKSGFADRAYDRAVLYLRLGQKDKALDELEKAYSDHDGADLPQIKSDVRLAGLRDEPRYKQIIRGMNYPE